MKGLATTYVLKIVFTLVFWCFPLLFLGDAIRRELHIEQPIVNYLFMLLGWAYIALCAGYGVGLYQLKKHRQVNRAPIFAGLVSNSGAAVLLLFIALRYQHQLDTFLFAFFLVSAAGAAMVTVNLLYFGLMRVPKANR